MSLRAGLACVAIGLIVQLVAWLFWMPSTFVLFALVGVPLVLLGVGVVAFRVRPRGGR